MTQDKEKQDTGAINSYRREFRTLEMSGAGVILTRAREPFRVIEALEEETRYLSIATEQPRTFKYWNVRDGWCEIATDTKLGYKNDDKVDPYGSLRGVLDLDSAGNTPFKDGIYVMSNIGNVIEGGHVPTIECLKHYAKDLPTTDIRLVIVVDEGFTLPSSLQHDIPIIDFDLPDRDEVANILQDCLNSVREEDDEDDVDCFNLEQIRVLTSSASGMTRMECELAFCKAMVTNSDDFPEVDFMDFNTTVLQAKTEVVKRSQFLEYMKCGNPDEIGGLENLKEWVSYRKHCFTDEARKFGVDMPKGISLIGSSGCGKTVSAKAISYSLGLPLIKVNLSKLFGGIVGETEKNTAYAMKQLEAMAPCIAFLDEVDKAGLGSGGNDNGVSTRLLGSMLNFMDESDLGIFWIFTANRVGTIPPELQRKGRLDEVFSVLPPNAVERLAVLKIHLNKRKQKFNHLDLEEVVDASENYVSAELEAVVKEAVVESFVNKTPITEESLIKHLSYIKPMSEAYKEDFEAIKNWASNNARPASLGDDDEGRISTNTADAKPARRRIRSRG